MKTLDSEMVVRTMAEWVREGVPFVVATVIGSRGSSPRKVGAKMLVAADGRLEGTVGEGRWRAASSRGPGNCWKRPR